MSNENLSELEVEQPFVDGDDDDEDEGFENSEDIESEDDEEWEDEDEDGSDDDGATTQSLTTEGIAGGDDTWSDEDDEEDEEGYDEDTEGSDEYAEGSDELTYLEPPKDQEGIISEEDALTWDESDTLADTEAEISADAGSSEFEMSPELAEEYNKTFSGEEQLEQQLAGIMNTVTISMKELPIDSIILSKFKKEQRSTTYKGLTGLVSTLPGVVTPIHVMTMEDSDDEYLLLDGVRRLFAATKAGKETINAVIWDFENKDMGRSLSNILGLILNRSQQFSNKELWHSLKVLDAVNNCSPGKIEFLLQLKSGDAMKLKDIMRAMMKFSICVKSFLMMNLLSRERTRNLRQYVRRRTA